MDKYYSREIFITEQCCQEIWGKAKVTKYYDVLHIKCSVQLEKGVFLDLKHYKSIVSIELKWPNIIQIRLNKQTKKH